MDRQKNLIQQEKIIKKYEYMFELRHATPVIYPIKFGFECEEGWYRLIDEILYKLNSEDPEKTCRIFQIKEKFGGLKIYLDKYPSNLDSTSANELMFSYDKQSYKICEVCGDPGTLCIRSGWYQTLCDKHRLERHGLVTNDIP